MIRSATFKVGILPTACMAFPSGLVLMVSLNRAGHPDCPNISLKILPKRSLSTLTFGQKANQICC